MKKNVASQVIGAQMCSATDGSAFTGSVTVYVTGNGGTQAIGSVGSGACTHEGNGFHTYVPAQAETNHDHVGFTFIGAGAVPATVQVYTSFPQTGDAFDRLGAPAGASVSADVAAAKSDTAAIKTKTDFLPSATAGAADGLFIAGSNAATAVNFTGNLSGSVGSVTGAVGSVTGLTVANLDVAVSTRMATYTQPTGFLAATFPTGTIANTTNITAGTITTATNLTNLPSIPANWLTAAGIAASALDGKGDWNTTTPPTVAAIADAVWDEAMADHLTGGTTGASLNGAGSAGDPWTTPLPGAYSAGTAGHTVGTYIDAAISGISGGGLDAAGVRAAVGLASANLDTQLSSKATAAALATAQADLDTITGADGVTLATAQALYAPNKIAPLDAAATRAAVGLAAANLDTQLTAIVTDTAEIGTAGAGLTALASAANLATVAGYIDTEIAAIKAKTDNLPASPAATGDIPTAAAIADAVHDEALADHTTAGSAGAAWAATDQRGARTVIRGTAGAATTPSTTQFTPSALSPAGAAADQFKGRILIWDNDTATASLRGQATDITASSAAALPLLTFTALTTAPSSGDTFSIV